MNSLDIAKELLLLAKQERKLDLVLKELKMQLTRKSQELYDYMEDEGVGQLEVDGITIKQHIDQDYCLSGDLKGKQWDQVGVFFEWLKEIGEEGLIKTKESVPYQTRKKFLKDWQESGEQLPDFVEETFFTTVKYNKKDVERLATEDE